MDRLKTFKSFINEPYGKSLTSKLKKIDLDLAETFIKTHDHLELNAFESALNRWFLDKIDKPKKWATIVELVSSANSRTKKE